MNLRHTNVLILFAACSLLTHCAPGGDSEVEREDLVLHAVEELRIGKMEGQREYVFGSIGDVAVGENGVMFVADSQVPIIRMYDQEGIFLRNIGGEGSGPGEYRMLVGMQTFADGRMAAYDPRGMRINIYDPKGDILESFSTRTALFGSDVFQTDHSGYLYLKTVVRSSLDMPNPEFSWHKISPDGAVVDTIQVPLDEESQEQAFVLFTASGSAYPFIEELLTTMSPLGHLITGRNNQYRFQIHLPDQPPITVEREYAPVRVKPEEKTQWESWNRHYGTNYPIPDVKPPFKQIFTDSQGRIWIWRYVEAEYTEKNIGPHFGPDSRWWERPTYDLFDADGSFYATVILPWNGAFRDAADDYVWTVTKGEAGELYVSRLRLEKPVD